jgi:hypothetical protein
VSRPATKRRLIDRQRGDVETTNVAITLRRDEPSFFHSRHSMHAATSESVVEDHRPDSAESGAKRVVSTERDGYVGGLMGHAATFNDCSLRGGSSVARKSCPAGRTYFGWLVFGQFGGPCLPNLELSEIPAKNRASFESINCDSLRSSGV